VLQATTVQSQYLQTVQLAIPTCTVEGRIKGCVFYGTKKLFAPHKLTRIAKWKTGFFHPNKPILLE
jgi:hypothetical protein